jgi:DNA-binding response OmpR family regulator
VITDSGGLQEEAAAFEKPVLILRDLTERPEGVAQGIAKLVGTDKDTIVREAERLLADPQAYERMVASGCPYGDGYAAVRIVTSLAAREWPTASTWELAGGSSTMVSNVPAPSPHEPVRFTGPQEPPPVRVVLDVRIPELQALQAAAPERDGEHPSPIAVSVAQEPGPAPARELAGDVYVPYARKLDDGIQGLLESPGLAEDERYTDDLLDIDFRLKTATAHGRNLELTPTEFRLLTALVRNNDRVLAHEELLDLAWSKARKRSRQQVKLYVGYLRRKLRDVAGANPIQTVRGYGYRYRSGPGPRP